MQEQSERPITLNRELLLGLVLVIALYLIYSSVFLSNYLMNDELTWMGSKPDDIPGTVTYQFFFFGRALNGFIRPVVYGFIGHDLVRVQFVRFVNFALMVTAAVLFFRFLARQSKNSFLAFLVVMLLFTQISVQGMIGYSISMLTIVQPALWLSLLAFYVYFSDSVFGRFPTWLRGAAAFVILILAMQSTQIGAYFAFIPLSYLALTDWTNRRTRVLTFLGLSVVVLIVSIVSYKLGLDYWHALGHRGYALGENGVSSLTQSPLNLVLTAINPFNYWSAFKLWSFPYPLNNVPALGKVGVTLGCIVMSAWMLLVLATVIVELRRAQPEEKRQIIVKWLAVVVCAGLAAVWFLADSQAPLADHRPHVTLTLTGIAIFVGAYCFQVLATRLSFLTGKTARIVAVAVVLFFCLGAQSNVIRSVVGVWVDEMAYLRTQLVNAKPHNRFLIIPPTTNTCAAEPCGPWIGNLVMERYHYRSGTTYRNILIIMGKDPTGTKFSTARTHADGVKQAAENPQNYDVIIDWDEFARTQPARP